MSSRPPRRTGRRRCAGAAGSARELAAAAEVGAKAPLGRAAPGCPRSARRCRTARTGWAAGRRSPGWPAARRAGWGVCSSPSRATGRSSLAAAVAPALPSNRIARADLVAGGLDPHGGDHVQRERRERGRCRPARPPPAPAARAGGGRRRIRSRGEKPSCRPSTSAESTNQAASGRDASTVAPAVSERSRVVGGDERDLARAGPASAARPAGGSRWPAGGRPAPAGSADWKPALAASRRRCRAAANDVVGPARGQALARGTGPRATARAAGRARQVQAARSAPSSWRELVVLPAQGPVVAGVEQRAVVAAVGEVGGGVEGRQPGHQAARSAPPRPARRRPAGWRTSPGPVWAASPERAGASEVSDEDAAHGRAAVPERAGPPVDLDALGGRQRDQTQVQAAGDGAVQGTPSA